jgi:pyrroloquinoline-quinone synthase
VENTVWDRIEAARSRCNVLEHTFYQRWTAGELTADELADYSGQYRRAVEAIADVSDYVARELPEHEGLAEHAREEADHVALWDGFVDAVGGETTAAPNAESEQCYETWAREDSALQALARLYAIESGQPEISRTKLEGLAAHYDVPTGSGTHYFSVHRGRDVEHAAEARELLTELMKLGDEDIVVAAAQEAFEANWKLLDGVS